MLESNWTALCSYVEWRTLDLFCAPLIFPYHKKVTVYVNMSYPSFHCSRTFDLLKLEVWTPNRINKWGQPISLASCVCGGCGGEFSRGLRSEGNVFIMFSTHAVFAHMTTRNRQPDILTVTFLWYGKNKPDTSRCPLRRIEIPGYSNITIQFASLIRSLKCSWCKRIQRPDRNKKWHYTLW